MPSKGIDCYAYIAAPGVSIEFSVPKESVTKHEPNQFTRDHLEVDKKNLGGVFKMDGRFSFTVRRDNNELINQWVDINAMTGSLGDGTMKDMETTPSYIQDVIVTYSFYDAGPGVAGLPNSHACYVTVTNNNSDWMRDVAPRDSPQADQPLRKWVLPSSHDIGMNSLQTAKAMLLHAGAGVIKQMLGTLPSAFHILDKVSDSAINAIAPNIIRGLAVTQKDELHNILQIGGRYFEFRPARCMRKMQECSPLPDDVYFQHGAIPGMLYRQFLHDIVDFLCQHPDELIVVQNRWDGVPGDCPRPNDDELNNILNDVLRDRDLQAGNLDDFNRSVKDLRNDRKRLIITRDVNQVSNYDDAANATLTGDSIVDALRRMAGDPPKGHPITLLQCQATATNIRDVIIYSVLSSDASTSCLLATKPICDAKIMPLLRGDVGRDLCGEDAGLVVVLNDFIDGGTADVAISMCRQRLGC